MGTSDYYEGLEQILGLPCCHYQLQFNENSIKSLLKTHEPIFYGRENGDSPFHGLCQAHENFIKYYMT